jgi:hypothetical protein
MSVTNKITDNVTVGSANIFINGVDVGHLKDNIEFKYTREKLPFKPANMLGEVIAFAIKEEATITCKCAELRLKNIRLALGLSNTLVTGSATMPAQTGSCSYTPAAGTSWDYMKFGGDKSEATFCVRLEHKRPNGKTFIVILYKAISMTELNVPFTEDAFTLHDLVFKGLADAARAEGDQLGIILDQVN